MSFGIFEAAVGSEVEVGLARQASIDNMSAAIYDVREKLGPILFASRDVEEFRHKVAMMKADQSVYKIIEAHTFPLPKVIRRIVGNNSVLENEFRQHLADNGVPGVSPTPMPGANPIGGPVNDPMNNTAPGTGVSATPTPGMQPTAMRKGAPFAGYEDFDDCTSKNSDKGRPDAYCGEIKHRTEDKKGNRTAVYDTIDHPKWPNGVVDTNETFEGGKTDKELKPKGDFKGYLNKVDQGARGKVERNFTGEGTEHTEDPAKHNFASKEAVALYADWCRANELSPIRLSSLDRYAENLSTGDYFRLANVIFAWENTHNPKVPSTKLKKKDKVAGQHTAPGFKHEDDWQADTHVADPPQLETPSSHSQSLGDVPLRMRRDWGSQESGPGRHRAMRDPMPHYVAWCRRNGYKRLSARNIDIYARGNPQLAYFLGMRAKEAIRTARRRVQACWPGCHENEAHAKKFHNKESRRRQAAPDYLQKADDALTQLLNQKAEEFQETIQPLQLALQTVQQAEQLQQQQNPLNVLPPPGTVNVMPGQGQQPSTAGQVGMPDPNAPDISSLVQMLGQPGGGGAQTGLPPGGGGEAAAGAPPPAAAGGGLPPDMDPAAQKAARRGKGAGAFRPRQAAGGVGELWDNWKNQRSQQGDALRGDEVDYSRFQQEHNVGDRAMSNLRQRNQTPDFAPINGVGRGRAPGTTVGNRRRAAPLSWVQRGYRSPTPPEPNDGHKHEWQQLLSDGYSECKHCGIGNDPAPRSASRRQARWDEEYEPQATHTDDFHSPAPGSPQAEYQHPGQARGWQGKFDQDQYAPYTGEYYSKGNAKVRGGPGPEGAKYYLHTPHGRSGPHHDINDAFDAAEPFLQQDSEISNGQGTLMPPPGGKAARRARGDARQRRPLARRKQAWSGWGPAVHPKTRQVEGWNWDNYQNGYLASRPQHFACECGDSFPAPSGFHRCACGRQWNSYPITNIGPNREASTDKFIVREIPVRPDVIVANKKLAVGRGPVTPQRTPQYNRPLNRPDSYRGKPSQLVDLQRGEEPEEESQRDFDLTGAVQLVDRFGNIHNLIDPGEVGEGEDPGHSTFRKPPKDWARRGDGAKWTKSPIG